MTDKSNNTKKSFFQLIKFGLVGVLNTVVDFLVFTALTFIFGVGEGAEGTFLVGLFTFIGYACGVINSFFFNSRWTFKDEYRRTAAEVFKFIFVNLISWGATFLLVLVFSSYVFEGSALTNLASEILNYTQQADIDKVINTLSKLLAVPIVIVLNFMLNKLFVFRGSNKSRNAE